MNHKINPNLIYSPGTQIVSLVETKGMSKKLHHPDGSVGVIVQSPVDNTHSYRIRFVDGDEIWLKREEFAIKKQFQKEGIEQKREQQEEFNLYDHIIFKCVIGSRAYGLDRETSDTDYRGIYLPPANLHWSLYGIPEQLENKDNEECYWELQKFIVLALKANPNIFECLYSPMIVLATPLAQELLDMRSIFLSKLIYQTYNGYVTSQFKKMESDLRNKGQIKWKHAMHLIRLLLSGITILKEGFVPVRVEQFRDMLLAIRDGQCSLEEVEKLRLSLHREFDKAFSSSLLPQLPDYEKANAFLLKARHAMVKYD